LGRYLFDAELAGEEDVSVGEIQTLSISPPRPVE
jgi:hypothetical protein